MEMAVFKRESNQAKEFFLRDGNTEEAMIRYESALRAAERMKWTDGVVMTKRAMSEILTAKKNYSGAEVILKDSLEICANGTDCSSQQMAALYDNLMFLYLFQLKNESKAWSTLEAVASSREKLSQSEDVDSTLNRYKEQMKIAGFER